MGATCNVFQFLLNPEYVHCTAERIQHKRISPFKNIQIHNHISEPRGTVTISYAIIGLPKASRTAPGNVISSGASQDPSNSGSRLATGMGFLLSCHFGQRKGKRPRFFASTTLRVFLSRHSYISFKNAILPCRPCSFGFVCSKAHQREHRSGVTPCFLLNFESRSNDHFNALLRTF